MQYDVFNGDADGIFSLHQLRLSQPCPETQLITGVKRDIGLLSQLQNVEKSSITVLDVSLDHNRLYLERLLPTNTILYIDHHFAGEIPQSENLEYHIDPSPHLCTSLIVNSLIDGQYVKWAICGAFGDNLHDSAHKAAAGLSLTEGDMSQLREIGELFNYNGYGADLSDLHFPPDHLYRALQGFDDPLDFFSSSTIISTLRAGFKEDMARALTQKKLATGTKNRVYYFPQAAWARRVTGTFSNLKAREKEAAAHAIIVENMDSTLQVSVRAPLANRKNADTLCRRFPTGGGRSAAAGINNLPAEMFDDFLLEFQKIYP